MRWPFGSREAESITERLAREGLLKNPHVKEPLAWPRVADQFLSIAATSLAADPGQYLNIGPPMMRIPIDKKGGFVLHPCPGALLGVGDFSGVEVSKFGANWEPMAPGFPYPAYAKFRKASSGVGGTLALRYWMLEDANDLDKITNLSHLLAGAAGKGGISDLGNANSRGLITPAIAGTQVVPSSSGVTVIRWRTDANNTNPVFAAETQAKAALLNAAGGGYPTYATGEDWWPVKLGNLFLASASGVEKVYVREEFNA